MSGVYSRLLFAFVMLVAQAAVPATGGEVHSGASIPWPLIFAQTFNFLVFVGILVYIVKKFLVPVFPQFRKDFLDEAQKAQKIMQDAQREKKEIEDRINNLETTYSHRLDKAKKESIKLKDSIVKENTLKAQRLVDEASQNALALFKSSEKQFKMKILDHAISNAKVELSKSMDEKQMQRLHGEFLEEIRVNP